MTQEQYDKLSAENPNVGLVRPFWNDDKYHEDLWKSKDITVLICQRQTKAETQLCLESLLRFYPDIPVLVVDGDSNDDSTLYLRWKSALYPNVKVWERKGLNSHGETMNDAIRAYIETKYVLLMDSDVITERGGYIEGMLDQFKSNPELYATGNLMLVTEKNEACGAPYDESDVLRYAHPCCSIYNVQMYKELLPFVNHGAPCFANMIHAKRSDLKVEYYPVDKYTSHLSGASWTTPKTIWNNDHNVIIRPLVTFITSMYYNDMVMQSYYDFDIVPTGYFSKHNIVIHGKEPQLVESFYFDKRFNVTGEYVCELNKSINENFMKEVAEEVAKNPADTIIIQGVELIKRKLWQETSALK